MNPVKKSFTTYELPKMISEGMTVVYTEKAGPNTGVVTIARVVNVEQIGNDFKFNLIDVETGEYLSKPTGEPRSWMWNIVRELKTLQIPISNEYLVCSICKENVVHESQPICHNCIRNEKKNFFKSKVKLDNKPFLLDDEQVDAVLSNRHSLVTARAGSGKTRVLTAKLIDLFYNQGVKEDEVLAFCFNRDAAEEIRTRLNSKCTVEDQSRTSEYDVVNTFHAFAKSVLGKDCGKILVDDSYPIRTRLIKQIISNFRKTDPTFENQLRKYFLSNTLKIDRKKFANIEHYYQFVRNSRYRTLKGEHVKSVAEKYIADFLFEHDIKYTYERHFFLNKIDRENHKLSDYELEQFLCFVGKGETVPDFYLEDYNLVWEHWGITGKETDSEKAEFSREVGDYNTYARTKNWKKYFWNSWRYKVTNSLPRYSKYNFKYVKKLIETDPTDFQSPDRSYIEFRLKELLESYGVKCEKLPTDKIMSEVWKNAEDYFTRQIRQFIDKFQQIYMNNESAFIENAKLIEDEREKTFLRLGYLVYKKYTEVLSHTTDEFPEYDEYYIDFNQCLYEATKKILSGNYDHSIKQLKWILIDEYQDFSELFYGLIHAILSRNPNITLFCVGDDWQAINRFAGSDLKFFLEFKTFFPNSDFYNISTNYRCENHIVENAGYFMRRFDIKGKPQQGILKDSGVFEESPIDDIKFAEDISEYEWLVNYGGPWYGLNRAEELEVQAYMKICSQIINENPGKKIMILNRKGSFLGKDLDEIERILKSPKLCKVDHPDIYVKTVHRSKGEEADIVILTEVDENCFPIFHQDSNLFSIFGENELTIMEDEARLYYVALTRAKHSIYIFFSKKSPSCFIADPSQASKKRFNAKK